MDINKINKIFENMKWNIKHIKRLTFIKKTK